ncbi:hypothetical protein FNV43_RR23976 [Rhamnella rubrinervis]|uniref:Uncharacterized protein n=1 Tax=Rhamnella rubrinervis TaxID=2594499 RepID=A0A8K0DRL4_9ROSA|nr:hypothetical protein FNV43_RR23976 [Rhamnella rubrinervis]
MEESSMKSEASCVELELEIQKRNSDYEALEAKFRALEAEKLDVEEKLKALKRENDQLKSRIGDVKDEKEGCRRDKDMEKIVDLTEDSLDEDKVTELMIENKVLECEKEKAESEVNVWKEKFKDLELWVSHLDESSTSKGAEWLLAGRTKVGLRVRNLKSNEDGLHVGGGSDYVKNKDGVIDLVHIGCKTIDNLQAAGFPNGTPYKHGDCIGGEEKGVCIKSEVDSAIHQGVRKQLVFEDERSPIKKMAPSTPGGTRPSSLSIIDIADSDDESSNTHMQLPIGNQGSVRTANSSDCAVGGNIGDKKEMTSENSLKWAIHDQNDEEDIDACKRNLPLSYTPKRKRASNCVISESESDDDNIPICELKRMRLQEIGQNHVGSDLNNTLENATAAASVDDNAIATVKTPRRRLVALRNCREKGRVERKPLSHTSETKQNGGSPTNTDSEDDESKEVSSDSEGESLHGFIVSSSDVSGDDGACSESEDVSDVIMNYSEILSNLGRRKDSISKWEFEADMLAAFGKDPELCMKAVCALYRQQTSEEKICKGSLYSNHRGFSKFDARRGTTLGMFLTDGDSQGDVTKSVQELQKYDPKGIELCRKFATHYSKQLFEIYKNKEDPFFLP